MNIGVMELARKLSKIPSYSKELGLDLRREEDRFKWFLASMLFAKRISADIAKKTYLLFEAEELTTPEDIVRAGWDKLVEVLDAGGYVRYDFSTASTLLETMGKISSLGGLERIHEGAEGPEDLERRLQELKGVGPVATNIFLRELRGIWSKARPKPSRLALEVGRRLGLRQVESFESALVRLGLEYCKRRRCSGCPVKARCREAKERVKKEPRRLVAKHPPAHS
jgi:endonuclease III